MIRIGILINEFQKFENWEYRVINAIRLDSNMNICILLKDDRFKRESRKTLSNFIFQKQVFFEKKRYLDRKYDLDISDTISFLEMRFILWFHEA